MKTPDEPDDERARIKALRLLDVLDTPAEERFDRLVRMAKRIFDVPIALVSLVDENRQWFKSCVGLEVSETPRDISFCGHAILGDGIFIIPNATKDGRFSDNPLVVDEPYIRFHAGCPLMYQGEHKLSTLCIIDDKPRDFSQSDLELLTDLASTAERELAAVQLATIDDLTSIVNRRGFMMLGQHTINLCERQRIPATLVFFDLDNFKKINDRFGHSEGDGALIDFSKLLNILCRDSDLSARLGGDEFVILFVDAMKEKVEQIIERLKISVDICNQMEGREYTINFSRWNRRVQC